MLLTQSMPFTLCPFPKFCVSFPEQTCVDCLAPHGILIALMVLQESQSYGSTGTDNCKIFKRPDWSIITGSRNQEEKVSEMNLKEQTGDKDVGKWRILGHMRRAYA